MEPPWIDDLADDLQSININSTTTTTDINRSTSSGSETTWTTATSLSAIHNIPFTHSTITFTKPHAPSGNPCWGVVRRAGSDSGGNLSLTDLSFLHRLGAGDIYSVYLAEVKSSSPGGAAVFAAKVMDMRELASRNKEGRARMEKEILKLLSHSFLPMLYASLESPKWSCLLMEFCPDGDLHIRHQRQACKRLAISLDNHGKSR